MKLTREELEEMLKVAKYSERSFKLDKDLLSHHNTYITLLESVLGLSEALENVKKITEPVEPRRVENLSHSLLNGCFDEAKEALERFGAGK